MATSTAFGPASAYICRQCLSAGTISDCNTKGNMVMHLGAVHAMGPFQCSVCPGVKKARREGVESHMRAAVRSRDPVGHGAAQVVRVQALQDAISQEADECKWPHSSPWVAPGPVVAANPAPTTSAPSAPVVPAVVPPAALSATPPPALSFRNLPALPFPNLPALLSPLPAVHLAPGTTPASPSARPARNGRETRSSSKRKQAEAVDEDNEDDEQEEKAQKLILRNVPSTRGVAVTVSKSRRPPTARRTGKISTQPINKEETAEEKTQTDREALEKLLFG